MIMMRAWRPAVKKTMNWSRQLDLLGHAIAEQPAATREAIAAALVKLGRR